MTDLKPAINRVFRLYSVYCENWNEDSLYSLLHSLHSLDDKLKVGGERPMLDIPEYVALKALRNFWHHRGELAPVLRIKSIKGLFAADLMYACLVPAKDCAAALEAVDKQYRNETKQAMDSTFRVWGSVVDINPCVFNCLAKVYALLEGKKMAGDEEDFEKFTASYEFENEHGHSHFVTGALVSSAADASRVQALMEQLYAG
jgi:hypothetical protein